MGYARLPCCAVLEFHRGHDDTTRAHFNSPKLNDYFLLVSFWLRDRGVKSKEKERKGKKKRLNRSRLLHPQNDRRYNMTAL